MKTDEVLDDIGFRLRCTEDLVRLNCMDEAIEELKSLEEKLRRIRDDS